MKSIKIFAIFFLIFGNLFLFAQEELLEELEYVIPNYESIKKNIEDKSSEFYYPDMLQRLENLDTLMTAEHYHHLYYGYVFNDRYSPYTRFSKRDELNNLLNDENPDLDELSGLLKEALKENPMDLSSRLILAGIYQDETGSDYGIKLVKTFEGLLESLLFSGDGHSTETAFHVISTDHEYLLVDLFGLRAAGQALLSSDQGPVDKLSIVENEYGISELYFNVNQLFVKQSEIFEGK